MTSEPLWLSVARMTEGIAEIPGPASEQIILKWADDIGAPAYTNDDIAWCAVWMNRLCMAVKFPKSGQGYDLLRARSFATWGVPLVKPSLGCIMVFSRPEGAHVGLYLGESATRFYVLGGNTANKVGAAWLAKERLVAQRWPLGVPLSEAVSVTLDDAGAVVSIDEA